MATPKQIEEQRLQRAAGRRAAQQSIELTQIDPSLIQSNTPDNLKPQGTANLGKKFLDLGRKTLKLILPKLTSLASEFALDQFNQAKDQATSPEAIAQLKAQYCPSPQRLQQLVEMRNNIVGQLNTIGNQINTLNNSVTNLQSLIGILQNIISIETLAKIGISAAAKFLPTVPGFVPSILNDLETIDDNVIPVVEKNASIFSGISLPFSILSAIINKIVKALQSLDSLISLCLEDSGLNLQLDPISDVIQVVSNEVDRAATNDGSYKGFTFQIEEVPFSPTVTRRRALALNQSGVSLLQTGLSFTTNNQTLINELKLIIDRDNLKAY
jgi:hypothetical protein